MKKWTIISFVLFFTLFSFSGCAKKPTVPKAGSAGAEDMLTLIPESARGVIVIDLHRALTTELTDKAIKENKNYQKYQEFIKETGVDPQKDVYFVAIGLSGEMGQDMRSGVGVINLRYKKDALMAKIKEKDPSLKEENYNGINIFASIEENQKSVCGAFLDESNIAVGSEKDVKAVIDIYQKKGENVLKNKDLIALLKPLPKNSLVWSAFLFSPETTKQLAAKSPMLASLEAVKSLVLYLDYKDKNLVAEIKVMSSDAEKNQQTVDFLNGLKALGGMAAAQKPEVGELMNRIEITSGPDQVKIYVNIPEDLMKKLSEAAKKQVEDKLKESQKPEEEKKD